MATSNPNRRARRVSREPLSLFPDTPRWCPSCHRHLPREAFNREVKNKDGLRSTCRECHSATKKAAYTPEYAARLAVNHIKRTYSIGPEEFAAMVAAQGNLCAICGTDMGQGKHRHVDHCHETGRVRSLLCHHCNMALGHAEDSPDRLREMADYIERWRLKNI